MSKFKVGDIVKFIPERWEKSAGGTFTVKIDFVREKSFDGTILLSNNDTHKAGTRSTFFGNEWFELATPELPFRDLRGRFAKKRKITLFLREIRVVPVIVEAASVEDAEAIVREGDGDYQNEKAVHSDLDAGEYFDVFGENEAIVE